MDKPKIVGIVSFLPSKLEKSKNILENIQFKNPIESTDHEKSEFHRMYTGL